MKRLVTNVVLAGLMVGAVGVQKEWEAIGKVEARQEWVLLGERSVSDNLDHDTIPVTVARGDFRRLKFVVRGHAIQMLRMVVHYGNGASDKIETRELIPAGGESRAIDLRGGERAIKKIDFWYETKSLGRQRALVKIYGER